MTAMEERYGKVEDYCPDPKGFIPEERIEIFLAVRDSMAPVIKEWEEGLSDFSEDIQDVENSKKPFWKVLGLIRKGIGVIPEMAAFYTVRNEALIKEDMGEGEYTYLYILIYYSWLGKSPADGPEFNIMGDNSGSRTFRFDDDHDKQEYVEDVRERRQYRITEKVRKLIRPMMRCQLDALKEQGIHNSWRSSLKAELDAMNDDRDRLPWQKGLPRSMDTSLRYYRDRLEASYSPMMNPMEIGPDRNW